MVQEFAGPFADIHRHHEGNAWLDIVLAHREGRDAYDWQAWRNTLHERPPGVARLLTLQGPLPNDVRDEYLDQPSWTALVLEASLRAAAESGAILAELRLGAASALVPDFARMFRAAEAKVQEQFPEFTAVPVLSGLWPSWRDGAEAVEAILEGGPNEFAAVDFLPLPYEEATDWELTFRAAEALSSAGFGITVHSGEFTTKHLAPAIECPGVTRLGHGTQLSQEPKLLKSAIDRQLVLECSLTSNVLLGAVNSLEEHPLRSFLDSGARVAICTDDPARYQTSIADEYALAASIGLSDEELKACTRVAVEASFAPEREKARVLGLLDEDT
jgi:adenosine deaminase